jgi:hypothetical protein
MSGERDLWAAVLDSAIQDLKDGPATDGALEELRLWFASNTYEPGSFLWICDNLDFDATFIRRQALGYRRTDVKIQQTG